MQYESIPLRPTTQDLTGQSFDRLTVLCFAGYSAHRQAYWTCLCICGTTKDIQGGNLRHKITRSCGCLLNETNRQRLTIHNQSRSTEYVIWSNMLRRCENPDDHAYKYYGGRGITVCEAWHNFHTFYADMGSRPSSKHSLERRNTQTGYHPENCVWILHALQQRNTRRNLLLTHNNITQCAAAWAEVTGIPAATIRYRKHHHWSDEETLTIPIGYYKPNQRPKY